MKDFYLSEADQSRQTSKSERLLSLKSGFHDVDLMVVNKRSALDAGIIATMATIMILI